MIGSRLDRGWTDPRRDVSAMPDTVPVLVGHVTGVSGAQLAVGLRAPDATDDRAEVDGAARIGSLVKLRLAGATAYGVVSRLAVDGAGAGAQRTAAVDLIGELIEKPGQPPRFLRGVSQYPHLGAEVFAATGFDLRHVYAQPHAAHVRVGTLAQDPAISAYVSTDDLLAKHFAILGSTGSGKSCTVTLILRAILGQHANAHVVMFDPHREYTQAFGDFADVLDPSNLELPSWLLDFEELCQLLVYGVEDGEREAQVTVLRNAVLQARCRHPAAQKMGNHVTVDTPVPYHVGDLVKILDEGLGKLDKPDRSTPYLRLKARIEALCNDRRYAFMFSRLNGRDSLTELMSRLLRIPVQGRPMTIVDLSGMPSEIVDVVVSLLSRVIFDFALWSAKPLSVPVLLVCEEAHRYIPERLDAGFEATRLALSRIAKEGRKYGVSLCLVTQRPSELSPSVLSQCGTIFALRMGNERDQEFVTRALPETARNLVGMLPGLRVQEAVVVGEGAAVPMRVRLDDLDPRHQPRSESASFATTWQQDRENHAFVTQTIQRWRLQQR